MAFLTPVNLGNDGNIPNIVYFIQDSANDKQVSSNGTTNQILLTFPQSDADQGINNFDFNSSLSQSQLERVLNSHFDNINDSLGNVNLQNTSNTAFPTQYVYNLRQTNEISNNNKKGPGRPRKDGLPINSKLTMVKCDDCGAICRSGVIFQRHLDKVHPEKKICYKCDKCSAVFKDEKKYLYHLVDHWESGSKCPCGNKQVKSCDVIFNRRAALCAHIEKYHLKNPQNMIQDTQSSNQRRDYYNETSPYKCIFCGKGFDKPNQVKRHMLTHTKEKPFQCSDCGMKFTQKNSLIRHIHAHQNDKQLKCQKCPAKFHQSSNLITHTKQLHPDESLKKDRVKCQYCECYFKNSQLITSHVYKYHPETMNSEISQLSEEIVYPKKNTKRNKGDILQAALSSSGLPISTSKNVNKEQRKMVWIHTCPVCKITFKKLYEFKKHVRIHSEHKNYGCDFCGKRFHVSSNLKSHLQNVHIKRNLIMKPIPDKEDEISKTDKIPQLSIPEYNPTTEDLAQILKVTPIEETPTENLINFIPSTTVSSESFINDSMLTEIQNNDIITSSIENPDITSSDQTILLDKSREMYLSELSKDPNFSIILDNSILIDKPDAENENPIQLSNDSTILTLNSNYYVENLPLNLTNEGIELLHTQNLIENDSKINKNTIENMTEQLLDETSHLVSTAINPNLPNMNTTKTDSQMDNFIALNICKDTLRATKTSYKFPPMPNKCKYCPASFKKPSDLVRHVRTHTKEKPFSCTMCRRYFTSKSTLYAHQKLHTSQERFKCSHCGKELRTKKSLKVHMRIHNNIKPFECAFCKQAFHTTGNLNSHLATHFNPY